MNRLATDVSGKYLVSKRERIMKKSKLFERVMTVIIVLVLGAPTIAFADGKRGLKGVSVKVSYADLNLKKQAGAKDLYWRLKQASRQACDVRGLKAEGSLKQAIEARQCYREALATAVQKIDSELATAKGARYGRWGM